MWLFLFLWESYKIQGPILGFGVANLIVTRSTSKEWMDASFEMAKSDTDACSEICVEADTTE